MKRVMLVLAAAFLLAGCSDDDAPPSATATPESTATITPTPSFPPTETRTTGPSRTPTHTPSVTPTLGAGANIGYIGILRADNTVVDPSGSDDEGRAIFERPTGSGFVVVVEAERGTNNRLPGDLAFNPDGPPDFQIESNRPLGDGSPTVCDNAAPIFGGVPGIDPPNFDDTQAIADLLNDFGCRFTDGNGQPIGRTRENGCVLFSDGDYGFIDASAQIQFCGTITRPMRFEPGDTILTARVLDVSGLAGPQRQIVVRVLAPDEP